MERAPEVGLCAGDGIRVTAQEHGLRDTRAVDPGDVVQVRRGVGVVRREQAPVQIVEDRSHLRARVRAIVGLQEVPDAGSFEVVDERLHSVEGHCLCDDGLVADGRIRPAIGHDPVESDHPDGGRHVARGPARAQEHEMSSSPCGADRVHRGRGDRSMVVEDRAVDVKESDAA